jgi:hypothetical protein
MANVIDAILSEGIQKKKKRSDIQAVLLQNNVDLDQATQNRKARGARLREL